jgi:hypothetical protein
VIVYADGFDTPVSCDKRLTYFKERLLIALVHYLVLLPKENVKFSVAFSHVTGTSCSKVVHQSVY